VVDVLHRSVGRTAADLRQATLDVHRLTEQNPFISDLMAGRLGIGDLARLTGQLRSIYAALESSVARHRREPLLGRLFDPRLDRLEAIDHDLRALALATGTAAPLEALPATRAYVARIHEVGDSAARLVAHHYVRYLGDLSGGQIIATLMRRHYGVADDALTFYEFEGLGSKGGFKAAYRRNLDALLAAPGTFEEVVDEVRIAYEANRQVFIALGPTRS
jgi:heme oxygenase